MTLQTPLAHRRYVVAARHRGQPPVVETGGGGRYAGQRPQRVLLVAGVVDAVAGNVGVAGGPAGGLPPQPVGEAGLVAETFVGQTGAVEAVQLQPGWAGSGGVGGHGADELAVVDQ
ncbi:hypothetical protein, partial [Spirosoma pomorum]